MKNIKLQVEVCVNDLNNIETFYGASDKKTIEAVIENILERYLNVEHFDPELVVED